MTLTIQDLGALGELLGSVAVLATLVYLALQTRQNTMAISAQLEAATLGATQDLFLSVATSTEFQEAMAEDSTIDRTTNQLRLGFVWTSILTSMQWHVHQGRRSRYSLSASPLLSTLLSAMAFSATAELYRIGGAGQSRDAWSRQGLDQGSTRRPSESRTSAP